MKHLKKFNENNVELNISGLKCDNPNCDYNDPSVPFSDYEKSVNKPCPKCGDNLLTQDDYNQTLQMVQAVELLNKMTPEEIDALSANLSEEEIDSALDVMNQLKMRKESEDENGVETWSASLGKDIRPSNEGMKHLKKFNESSFPTMDEVESASPDQIMQWQRFLNPKNMDEVKIVNAVHDRYVKLKNSGDINSSTSKRIGW